MKGLLYVFHGSQKQQKNQAAMNFIRQLEERIDTSVVQEIAFLENHPHTITQQAKRLIEQGCDHVIVVPVLLFAAKHALMDIPKEMKTVQDQYPQVHIQQTETFGSKAGSRAVLLDRFLQAKKEAAGRPLTGVLLAHGTKMTQEPQQTLTLIAEQIQEVAGFPIAALSLKGEGDYTFEIGKLLQQQKQVVIVPFFLFEGHLIHLLKAHLSEVFPEERFVITPTLEFDSRIIDDLESIVKEALYVSDHG